jgi:opacity protein-like surface antigen
MKKITLVLLLLTATIANAQQLYVEGGKSSTTFDYKNSQGTSLGNLQATANSYMGFGYKSQLFTKNLHLNVGLHYAGYGAMGSDDAVGNFMEWEVDYAGLNVGLALQVFKIKKAAFYVQGAIAASVFMQGTQTLNNSVIDLKNNDDFDTTLVTMQAGAGFSHPISENLSFYVQYVYGKSLDMASGDAELKIKSNNLSFGLLIDISKKQATEKPATEK